MSNAILYRFHRDIETVAERLKILRYLNPDVPIYGLYGGDDIIATKPVRDLLDDLRAYPERSTLWKWLHADAMIAHWYREFGHTQTFTTLLDHEWDVVFTAPHSAIYPTLPDRTVSVSGRARTSEIIGAWQWTSGSEWRDAFLGYCRYMGETYNMGLQTYVCQGPASAYCRSFLDELAAHPLPMRVFENITSEISLPGLAQALGFEIRDNGLHLPWSSHVPSHLTSPNFHCMGVSIDVNHILREAAKPVASRRAQAFHPVKDFLSSEDMIRVLHDTARPPAYEAAHPTADLLQLVARC